ncbi:thioredoxin domain-containing protein 17-like [Aricia agestis]|uniref:thioredoxin domain-containing protein 17-like n=1 Tax=Aricia agestis TaxID=91739 RepID=UPI001C208A8B|nr:thioredoxin domain-containing protein 17-like [Aricia agestis]
MVTYVNLKGFEEFDHYTNDLENTNYALPVFFYFTGTKLPNGDSWCPDCVVAEPVVKAFLNEYKKPVTFVSVDVGVRDAWKDVHCLFRTDYRSRLMVIPTIIKWKGVQRLEGTQCADAELLQMIFEEDE